jgi:putative ABC transport system substrate-binding protein
MPHSTRISQSWEVFVKEMLALTIITAFFLCFVSSINGQQITFVRRIGFIFSSGTPAVPSPQLEAFISGLRDLGYVEGKSIVIERRYAEGRLDRMAPFVREFVAQKVDVIIGVNNVVIQAAKEATKTIPIVMISSVDPVTAGYVESFARPGGNITGLAWLARELSAKRMELLKELLPKISRVGVLWDAAGPGPAVALKEYERAAQAFKLEFQSFEIRGPQPDLTEALRAAKKQRMDAVVVVANPLMGQHTKQVFALAQDHHLPTMTEERRYVDAGGLISYGASLNDLYRRAAGYVDRILKGEKPADMLVEQPREFEIFINLRTAKHLGLDIPKRVLLRTNELIE